VLSVTKPGGRGFYSGKLHGVSRDDATADAGPEGDDAQADARSRMSSLGPRLRARRREQGLTLAQVAERSGVTKGFLSLVERGLASVSVPTLLTLCTALELELGALFEYPEEEVVRAGRGAPLEMGGGGIEEFLLTPASEPHIQVMRTVLQPGGGSGGAYTLDCETVFVLVVRGTLALRVGGRERRLHAGDSTTFSARTMHAWENPGDDEAEVVWTLAPPVPDGPAIRVADQD
jgi:transcriptional regulator with XRE-family HTH domain